MEYPRAPWWNTEEISPPKLIKWPNPNAEISGYCIEWDELISESVVDECIHSITLYLEEFETESEFNIYHYLCWKRSLPYLPVNLADRLKNMMLNQINPTEDLTSLAIGHVKPQWLVTEETSFLYQNFPEAIDTLMRNEIDNQKTDGGWYPAWRWGENDIWETVEKEWAGKITVELLLVLKYCNLVDFSVF